MVFLALISWEIWACNLVQFSQQECVSSSKVMSATLVLALNVSQCSFQLSQAIRSQKISVVLGNTSVRKCEGGRPASGVGATLWEPAPVQHPLYFSECWLSFRSTYNCLAVPHWGHDGQMSLQENSGVGSHFRGFDVFLFFPWGRQGLWEWGWVPAALEHPRSHQGHQDSPCCGSALFYGAACSLPFPEGAIAESEAVHPSREAFWRTPAGSPTPPQSNIVSPQKNLPGQHAAGLEQPLRSAGLCIPLGLPGGSWTGFLLNQAQSMLEEGLF